MQNCENVVCDEGLNGNKTPNVNKENKNKYLKE